VENDEIVHRIGELADREHELRSQIRTGDGITDETHAQLETLEVQLDQCWDLLRQRRARREFADNPDGAEVRDAKVVEKYQQ
jgi:hypothetical protein